MPYSVENCPEADWQALDQHIMEQLTIFAPDEIRWKQKAEFSSPVVSTGFQLQYEHANGRLYQGDSIKWLESLPSSSVDLVFADPPYNIKKAEWDNFESQEKYIEWSIKWIAQASRVLKSTGSLYMCGFSEILADIKHPASKYFKHCRWLIWHYKNKANLGNDWGRSHEVSVGESIEFCFIYHPQHIDYRLLYKLVFYGRYAQRAFLTLVFWDICPQYRFCPIAAFMDFCMQGWQTSFKLLSILLPCHTINSRGRFPVQLVKALAEQFWGDVMQQCRKAARLVSFGSCSHAFESKRHHIPALYPAGGIISGVPLGQCPSLRNLRRNRGPSVRLLLRYYDTVRLPACVSINSSGSLLH